MIEIKVEASAFYPVIIDKNVLIKAGEFVKRALPKAQKLMVVSDDNVAPLYLKTVVESLQKSGYRTFTCVLKAGESAKSLENFSTLLSLSADVNMTREDAFVALGGGVIGDLTGFVSSAFMRGVRYVQIPTTFLAAIDSSVGGKTAVNLPEGKNLVGAFHQPSLVLFDTATLATLPKNEMLCGLGEAIKYCALIGEEVYEILNGGNIEQQIDRLTELCVEYKAKIVHDDEKESGVRKLLNLGHTVGHAVEKLSGFTVEHGMAVVKGLCAIIKLQQSENSIDAVSAEKLLKLCQKYGYDCETGYAPEKIAECIEKDKKMHSDGTVSVIKIRKLGDAYVEEVSLEKFGEQLQ